MKKYRITISSGELPLVAFEAQAISKMWAEDLGAAMARQLSSSLPEKPKLFVGVELI